MEDHIRQLVEATENISVRLTNSYGWADGHSYPTIAVRDEHNNGIKIDNIWWLIAGDVYTNNDQTTFLKDMTEDSYVVLRGQASVYGKIITIDLGKRKIIKMDRKNEYTIIAQLETMK